MAIIKEKTSDGFFEWVSISATMGTNAKQSKEELEELMNEWDFSTKKALNNIEKRITSLDIVQHNGTGRQSPKIQKHNAYYKLDQVEGYRDIALRHLREVRKYLEINETENAIIQTIYMMDAYWQGLIHTDNYKGRILRDKCQTIGKQDGGKNRSGKYEDCRNMLSQKASEVWEKQNQPKSISWMVEYLKKNCQEYCINPDYQEYCMDPDGYLIRNNKKETPKEFISDSSIRNYIKEYKPPRK